MSTGSRVTVGWEPLVYFWEGGWIGVGEARGTVPPHAHHAVQISIGLNGPVRIRHGEEEWIDVQAGVVLPDVVHAFDAMGSATAIIFVDPESFEGQWLSDSSAVPIRSVERERLRDHLPALTTFREDRPDALVAARMITGIVRSLCVGPSPLSRMDPRISRALDVIRQKDARTVPLEEAARTVFLSPSRFAHLFRDEVGLPFRRYMLWRKLNRAMAEFGRGSNLTDSAHAAGFSDSAHLTHTWHQMFGMSPSIMMGKARFYEIPAPFELVEKHPTS